MATAKKSRPHNQDSRLIQQNPKKYHTFNIVDVNNRQRASGVLHRVSSFFTESPSRSASVDHIDAASNHHSFSSSLSDKFGIIAGGELRHKYSFFPSQSTFYLFYFNILACSISFALVIPSLWSYLRELQCTELYLAYCISIYAIGEVIGSYFASMIRNKHNTKFVFIIAMLIGMLAGFVYGSAGLCTYAYSPYCVLIGRILQGIWTGMQQYTEIRYLAENVNLPKTSNALTNISFVSSVGFIVGPALGAFVQLMPNMQVSGSVITSNMLCGYLIMLLCTLELLLTMLCFENAIQVKLTSRNTFTRTVTVHPRDSMHSVHTHSPPKTAPLPTTCGAPHFNTPPQRPAVPLAHRPHLPRNNHSKSYDHIETNPERKKAAQVTSPTPPPPPLVAVAPQQTEHPMTHNNGHMYKNNKRKRSDYSSRSISPKSSNNNNHKTGGNELRRWMDSASPPSVLPCIPDDDDVEDVTVNAEKVDFFKMEQSPLVVADLKLKLTQHLSTDTACSGITITTLSSAEGKEKAKLTHTRSGSFLSDGQNTFHRTSVAEMLNIDTPTAMCSPYSPYTGNRVNSTPFTGTAAPNQQHSPHAVCMNSAINPFERAVLYDGDETQHATNKQQMEYADTGNVSSYFKYHTKKPESASKRKHSDYLRPVYYGEVFNRKFACIILVFCFLIHFEAFSIQQTLTSYLIQRRFGWRVQFANYLFILCAVIWMASFYIVNRLLLLKNINRINLAKLSLVLGVVSTFCLIWITFLDSDSSADGGESSMHSQYLYLFGFVMISFTFPFGRASIVALYCLYTRYKYVEWLYFSAMLARIISPFIGIGLYFCLWTPPWTYGNITVLFMIAIVLFSVAVSYHEKDKKDGKAGKTNHNNKKSMEKLQAADLLGYHGYSVLNVPQIYYIPR